MATLELPYEKVYDLPLHGARGSLSRPVLGF